jgi:DNA-binding IclR family transcriptional regulator
MTDKNPTYSAPVLYKAFAVLEEVARNQSELGISDISRRLGISKSTIYGITNALTDLGALRQHQETKKFRLGPALLQLGSQVLDGMDLKSTAKPLMDNLSKEFRETVFLGTFSERGIMIVEKVDSPLELKITAPIGTRIPIFAGATGKVFLAYAPEQKIERLLAGKPLPKYTDNTITSREKYLEELDLVKRSGYARDFEEYIQGVNAICVPVFDNWNTVIAALWMVGFTNSFTREKANLAVQAAMKAATELKNRLKSF